MTRLPLALAVLLSAVMATFASAQSYPQPYSNYGPGPMAAGAYGYAPDQSAAMPQSMPGAPMGPGAGYPTGYGPNSMPQGIYPPAFQNPAYSQSGAPAGQQGPANQSYSGPQQPRIAKMAPPPMKLPPGVTAENGLLYYNGSARADVDYQQYPTRSAGRYPVRTASYQSDGSAPSANAMNASGTAGAGVPSQSSGYAGTGASDGEQSCDQCGDNCDDGHGCGWFYGLCHGAVFPGKLGYCWSAGYDNLAMTRNNLAKRVIVFDTAIDPAIPVYNTKELNFGWDYGGKAHIELMGPSGITYQLTYMRVATFVAEDSVFGDNNLSLPFPFGSNPGFFDVDQVNFKYNSRIQGGELNMIFPIGSFEFVAGYRYMDVTELSVITAIDNVDLTASHFTAGTQNHLNGGQIGVLGRWEMFGLFDFDFDAKFGVYGNDATESQRASGTLLPAVGANGNATRVAFVTEIGAQVVVPLGPSWSVHCGYNAFFIDRVALAPDQFDFNLGSTTDAGTRVRSRGDIILQGVNLGVTAVW